MLQAITMSGMSRRTRLCPGECGDDRCAGLEQLEVAEDRVVGDPEPLAPTTQPVDDRVDRPDPDVRAVAQHVGLTVEPAGQPRHGALDVLRDLHFDYVAAD